MPRIPNDELPPGIFEEVEEMFPLEVAEPTALRVIDGGGEKSVDYWRIQLATTARGAVLPNYINAAVFIKWLPALKDLFEYDVLNECPVLTRDPPFPHKTIRQGARVDSAMGFELGCWLAQEESVCFPIPALLDAILGAAKQKPVDPIKNYFSNLPRWDMRNRLAHFHSKYLGMEFTDPDEPSAVFTRKWLISAVARAFEPGCQADHMLILEGDQAAGKTSALRALVPVEQWYKEGRIDVLNKDGEIANRFCWIREIGELSGLQRSEVEAVKSYLTRREDTYRPPYERGMVTHPRRVVFAGTTNKRRYLNDPSGGRRFWPVPLWGCKINVKLIQEDRDQIWAEAIDRYESKESWHLDQEYEQQIALPEQRKRLTPWAEQEGRD